MTTENSAPSPSSSSFQPTRWTLVQKIQGDTTDSTDALNELCKMYWRPLYAYARSFGRTMEDSEDVVQGFMAKGIEKALFSAADKDKGKMRTFLLTSFKRYLRDVHAKSVAIKRGEGKVDTTDIAAEEERWGDDKAADPTISFDKRWALIVVEAANEQLRLKYQEEGKADLYEALSYTFPYVDQIVRSRGKNLEIGKDVLPTKQRPRIRDNGWWLDSERKQMDFKSPAPWDKIQEDPRGNHKPTPDMAITIAFDDDTTKWKMQFLDGNAQKMIAEFTPKGQKIKDWKEMVAQEITFTPRKVSEHLIEWKAMITKADSDVEIKQTENQDGSVTVEYKSKKFNEYSIRKFMKSTDGIYALAYHMRLHLYNEDRSKTWAAIIAKSNLIPNPRKK